MRLPRMYQDIFMIAVFPLAVWALGWNMSRVVGLTSRVSPVIILLLLIILTTATLIVYYKKTGRQILDATAFWVIYALLTVTKLFTGLISLTSDTTTFLVVKMYPTILNTFQLSGVSADLPTEQSNWLTDGRYSIIGLPPNNTGVPFYRFLVYSWWIITILVIRYIYINWDTVVAKTYSYVKKLRGKKD